MKKRTLVLSLILCMAGLADAQVAATAPLPGDITISSISPAGQKTPGFSLSTGPAKRAPDMTWLEVEVEFLTKTELIDELTFEYSILLNNQLLTGSVTHVNIEKGREHYSVAYVSPRSIERLLGHTPFTASVIQNIQIRVTRQGQELAVKRLKPSPLPNVPQLAGFVLNKLDTPFMPLYWDRYEAIKPVVH